jgi:hypothetical protein
MRGIGSDVQLLTLLDAKMPKKAAATKSLSVLPSKMVAFSMPEEQGLLQQCEV